MLKMKKIDKRIFAIVISVVLLFSPILLTSFYAESSISPTVSGNDYIYEVEAGSFAGNCYLSQNVPNYSGSGSVNMLDGGSTVTMNINVPVAGKYKLFVYSANDAANAKCDKISVNDGTEYLVATPAQPVKTWHCSQPGTENWVDGKLEPIPVQSGFAFTAGVNKVKISVSWGYAYYDKIVLTPLEKSETVINMINELPETVTQQNAGAVLEAEKAYNQLVNEEKSKVTNYSILSQKLSELDAVALIPQNDQNLYSFELEDGALTGNSAKSTEIGNYSGTGSVNLFGGSVSAVIKLPFDGKYNVYVLSASKTNEARCDFVSINGAANLLVATPKDKAGEWIKSQPGTENWLDGNLVPLSPDGGYELKAGINTLKLSTNWGYAYYDKIIFEYIPEPEKKTETVAEPKYDGERLIYEAEDCEFKSNGAYKDQAIADYSGSGYVFVMDGGFKVRINVPNAGKYKLYVSSANNDGSAKCDYISVNGGQKYLAATDSLSYNKWTVSEPGTENWVNGKLLPTPLSDGFEFAAGENVIEVDPNWGYAAYDRFILVPLSSKGIVDENTVNSLNALIARLPSIAGKQNVEEIIYADKLYKSLNANDKNYIQDIEKLIRLTAMANSLNAKKKTVSGTMRYECEEGTMHGNSSVVTEKSVFSDYSGDGYVFLFDKSFDVDVYVEKSGYYHITVISGTTEQSNKCDFFQVNGGEKFLISTTGKKGTWTTARPGTENWADGKLSPLAPDKGFYLKAGKNTITVSANWGYCAYDAIEVFPQGVSPDTGDRLNICLIAVIMAAGLAFAAYSIKKILS